jgi:hypothetical protein
VFLDELFEAEIWGQNLVETLADVYENKARYCLIIVSENYRRRIYTNVERRAALDRAIRAKAEYILPVVLDGAWIQGLPKSTAYLDLRRKSVISICEAVARSNSRVIGRDSPRRRSAEGIFSGGKDHVSLPICPYFPGRRRQRHPLSINSTSRGTLEEMFLRLQHLFIEVAGSIEQWRANGRPSSGLWETMKDHLLSKKYTIYIEHAPHKAEEAVKSLAAFVEPASRE